MAIALRLLDEYVQNNVSATERLGVQLYQLLSKYDGGGGCSGAVINGTRYILHLNTTMDPDFLKKNIMWILSRAVDDSLSNQDIIRFLAGQGTYDETQANQLHRRVRDIYYSIEQKNSVYQHELTLLKLKVRSLFAQRPTKLSDTSSFAVSVYDLCYENSDDIIPQRLSVALSDKGSKAGKTPWTLLEADSSSGPVPSSTILGSGGGGGDGITLSNLIDTVFKELSKVEDISSTIKLSKGVVDFVNKVPMEFRSVMESVVLLYDKAKDSGNTAGSALVDMSESIRLQYQFMQDLDNILNQLHNGGCGIRELQLTEEDKLMSLKKLEEQMSKIMLEGMGRDFTRFLIFRLAFDARSEQRNFILSNLENSPINMSESDFKVTLKQRSALEILFILTYLKLNWKYDLGLITTNTSPSLLKLSTFINTLDTRMVREGIPVKRERFHDMIKDRVKFLASLGSSSSPQLVMPNPEKYAAPLNSIFKAMVEIMDGYRRGYCDIIIMVDNLVGDAETLFTNVIL